MFKINYKNLQTVDFGMESKSIGTFCFLYFYFKLLVNYLNMIHYEADLNKLDMLR